MDKDGNVTDAADPEGFNMMTGFPAIGILGRMEPILPLLRMYDTINHNRKKACGVRPFPEGRKEEECKRCCM